MASWQAGEVTLTSIDHGGHEDDTSVMTAKQAGKDILFGSFAGMVAEVFEYPFDLAKVRLQAQVLSPVSSTAVRFNGPMHCLSHTWKEEGLRGLYRGLPAPIVGSMAETATLFLAYSTFQSMIRSLSPNGPLSNSAPLSVPQLTLAAAGAGFVTSFVLTPIELVKCKMQVQMLNFHPPTAPGRIPRRPVPPLPSSSRLYHTGRTYTVPPPTAVEALRPPGPIALIRSIVDSYGVRGLWLGHTGMLVRETGGTAAWFMVKEWAARKLVARRIQHSPYATASDGMRVPRTAANTELLPWESAFSGALAGAFGALVFYPADTVKSAIQTQEELRPRTGSLKPLSSSFLGTFRLMWMKHGLKGLYAGCGMTVARAVPSSGIIFVVYDGLTAYFS